MKRNAKAFVVEPHNEDKLEAGACYFIKYGDEEEPRQPAGVVHACPCGCGGRSAMWFRGRGRGHQEWDVTGEWPNVTLVPSIGIRQGRDGTKGADGFHWHGYLRNGVFEEL